MRLMRNTTHDGHCKYAAVRMDKLDALSPRHQSAALAALEDLQRLGLLENPRPGGREEFLLLKLKDRHSQPAFQAYAASAQATDPELALDVLELATRAGPASRFCKQPD